MIRKIAILLISLSLCWTTFACGSPNSTQPQQNQNTTSTAPTQLQQGRYPVQQATYDDVNGEYTLMLLNTPSGTPPVVRTTDLQMARLTDEEIAAGEKTYLSVEDGQAVMHLTEDFRIEYIHNVTETQPNPQTGQPETVIVRQQSSFWSPFAGALAGQAVGSLLFRPQYYVPPVYQPGGVMTGFGGYGNTYSQAVNRYQERHQAPPPVEKNRQALRTTGRLRRSPNASSSTPVRTTPQTGTRATGSGVGSSNVRQSDQSRPTKTKKRPSSFGSSGSRSRPRRPSTRRRR
jgi:hypothetical protein